MLYVIIKSGMDLYITHQNNIQLLITTCRLQMFKEYIVKIGMNS